MDHVGGVNQGPKQGPGGIEAIMKGFQKDRGMWLRQFWQFEEDLGLGGVGYGRLFEEDMLPGADGADRPLKMQPVR